MTLDDAADAFAANPNAATARTYRDAAREYAADEMISENEARTVAAIVAPFLRS